MNPDHIQTLVLVLGGTMVLLLPTITTIIWKSWSQVTRAIQNNTRAIERLNGKLEFIWHQAEDMPKLKRDVNYLFEKQREGKL